MSDEVKVVIGIQQGVPFAINIPEGVSLEVRDYDVEGQDYDDLPRDDTGPYTWHTMEGDLIR